MSKAYVFMNRKDGALSLVYKHKGEILWQTDEMYSVNIGEFIYLLYSTHEVLGEL